MYVLYFSFSPCVEESAGVIEMKNADLDRPGVSDGAIAALVWCTGGLKANAPGCLTHKRNR
jgi:hypothetical protein